MLLKKQLCLVVLFCFIIGVVMCSGCGDEDNADTGEMEEKYVFEEISLYDKENSEISLNEQNAVTFREGSIYYATADRIDNGKTMNGGSRIKPKQYINEYDIRTGESKQLFMLKDGAWGLAEAEDTYINLAGLKIINDSIMLFWTFNDESMHSGINVFSMNGELKAEYDIHWPDDDKMGIDNVVIDIEGNSYVLGRSETWEYTLAKFSGQGELLDNVKFNESNFPWGMALDSSGKLVTYNNNGVSFYPGELNQPIVNKEFMYVNGIYSGDDKYPVYINDDGTCVSYDSSSNKTEELFRWVDMVGGSIYVDKAFSIGDGCFICRDTEDGFDAEKLKYGIVSKKMVPKDKRTVVKYAGTEEGSFADFNRTNKDYRIEFVKYDYETYAVDLYRDILAGNCPDIIATYGDINENEAVASGIVRELNSFIEADEEIGEDFFVPGLLDASKIGGKNYYLGGYFDITGLIGDGQQIGRFEDGMTVDEFIELYNTLDSDTRLFEKTSREGMAYTLIGGSMNSYIDWNTGQCSFDSGEFRTLLEFCAGFDKGEWDDVVNGYDADEGKSNDGKVLLSHIDINRILDLKSGELRYGGNGLCIGYPGENSTPKLSMGNMAIASYAEHPEGAWEFIKHCMLLENVKEVESFPVSMQGMKKHLEDQKKSFAGGGVTYCNDVMIEKSDLSEKDIDTVIDLVKRSKYDDTKNVYDRYSLIKDDIKKYFDGKRSLDETVNIINDRMTKYVNERR